ncbi:HM20A [Enterospora canceri]|uniref:HM20A n=1 Tax=Enterospora canceri TaxID=1081671 RepID=A0A1Y1S6Y7_9MICR|nr:HM20A [Enterospora canceri]
MSRVTNKKPKDKNAPKKPFSSYMLFGVHLRKTDPTVGSMKVTEQAKYIGSKWQVLDPKEKQTFIKMANDEKVRYADEYEKYKKTPAFKEYQTVVAEWEKKKGAKAVKTTKTTGQKLFVQEYKDNLDEDEKKRLGKDVSKEALKEWRALSDGEKERYKRKAKGDESDSGASEE